MKILRERSLDPLELKDTLNQDDYIEDGPRVEDSFIVEITGMLYAVMEVRAGQIVSAPESFACFMSMSLCDVIKEVCSLSKNNFRIYTYESV